VVSVRVSVVRVVVVTVVVTVVVVIVVVVIGLSPVWGSAGVAPSMNIVWPIGPGISTHFA
jgi:hypothetical protein